MNVKFMRLSDSNDIISRCDRNGLETVLKNPFIVKRDENNNILLVPYLPSYVKGDTITISNNSIIYSTSPNDLILKKYKEVVSKTKLIKLWS